MRKQLEILLKNQIIDESYNLNQNALCHVPCIGEAEDVGQVIGTDTRVPVPSPGLYPYFPIVRLLLMFPDGKLGRATGFLIGPDKAVTAGHCIYGHGAFVEDIVAIAEPGSANHHYGVCTGWRYSPTYPMSEKREDDWAILRLDIQLGGYAGVLPIIDWSTLPPLNTYIGEVPGYPGKAQKRATSVMWSASGPLTHPPGRKFLSYQFSTSSGQSGAPVLIQENGLYYVAGIHVRGSDAGNYARVIDTELYYELTTY